MKKYFHKIMIHPYWTAIATIVAIVAMFQTIDFTSDKPSTHLILKQISMIEIKNSQFNENRAREDLDMALGDTKITDAYRWKVKCEKMINYPDNYIFIKKEYKDENTHKAIEACTYASKLNSDNIYYSYLLAVAFHKNKNYDKSLDIIQTLARVDYSLAQRKLGIMYYFGFLIKKDIKKSKELILKSAQNGDLASQEMIDNGILVE